jgi:hypothetical protein
MKLQSALPITLLLPSLRISFTKGINNDMAVFLYRLFGQGSQHKLATT